MSNLTLTPDLVLKRTDDQLSSELERGKVLLSITNGMYYEMNPVGAAIWDLLAEARTFAELQTAVLRRFDVDEATCRQELTKYLGELHREQLLEIAPRPQS